MAQTVKREVRQFIKKHKLRQITYADLKHAAEDMGYTIIEFNSLYNENNVQTVINNLSLQDAVTQSKGFVYINNKYRLIFINECLNEEEKQLVLSHEIGHILRGHFSESSIIGKDVHDEFEANEFSHYLLKQDVGRKILYSVYRHRKTVTLMTALIMIAVISFGTVMIVRENQSYYGEYYVTETGNKYHKRNCIFVKNKKNIRRLTKEEFDLGKYEICGICLPDD